MTAIHVKLPWIARRPMRIAPAPVIKPGAQVGRTTRNESEEIKNRTLQPNSRSVRNGNRWEDTIRTGEAQDANAVGSCLFIEQRHMDRVLIAPQSEQGQRAVRERSDGLAPDIGADDRARPRVMIADLSSFRDEGVQHRHPSNPATFWNHATSAGGR